MASTLKLLIIGLVYPEPSSSAAGSRMLQLIRTFLSQGYEITFATTALKSENSFDLTSLGVEEIPIELNSPTFDDFLNSLYPHLVLFDRFITEEQFGWRVSKHCLETMTILDTEDLHCLRKGRQRAYFDQASFSEDYIYTDFAKREIASIYRCDLSLIISEYEMNWIQQYFKVPERLLHYLPFLMEPIPEEKIKNMTPFEERNHFVTVGTFLHEPNVQSILNLKKHLWPLLKMALPQAELHIYGAYPSKKIMQLHNEKQGFMVKGHVPDIQSTLSKYKICLAPLPFGAGLKGKIVDAVLAGTPCGMSTIAAEGMFGDLSANGFVEDDPKQFVDQAVSLYTNKTIWLEKQMNGFHILRQRFNKESFLGEFADKIKSLRANLSLHRQDNFTGSMLRHHTLQSHKYLSKWIESKNKDR